jgi:5-methylcytosine-specific restriction endonuclease McrA
MPAPKDVEKIKEWKEKIRIKSSQRKHTLEDLKKMSESQMGSKNHFFGKHVSNDIKKQISNKLKGRIITKEHRDKISKSKLGKPQPWHRGKKSYFWKGGVSSKNSKARNSLEYKLWRRAVFERDNYTCIWCGKKSEGDIEADHIKPFAYFPELRFAIDNGRTLCRKCHKSTGNYLVYMSNKPKKLVYPE